MKKFKRLIALVLLGILFVFSACAGSGTSNSGNENTGGGNTAIGGNPDGNGNNGGNGNTGGNENTGGNSGNNNGGNTGGNSDSKNYGTPNNLYEFTKTEQVEGTMHQYNIQETNDKWVSNGNTEYKILISADAKDKTKYAAEEMAYYIEKATGAKLTIEKDDSIMAFDGNSKYISIGKTKLREQCGKTFTYEELSYDGFKIFTYQKNIVISGYYQNGDLYGAYEFLYREIEWDTFAENRVWYQSGITELTLKKYDVIDVPDFRLRQAVEGLQSDPIYSKRIRFSTIPELFANPGAWCHNSFRIINPKKYLSQYNDQSFVAEHKDWFSHKENGDIIYSEVSYESHLPAQICYSVEDKEFFDLIVAGVKQWLIDSPEAATVMFSQEDNQSWCECKKCKASKEKYGANSAVVVKMLNRIAAALKPWLAEQNRHVTFSFFAYNPTEDAPTKVDGSGNYVPVDNSVVCSEDVAVMYAPIGADYSKPLTHVANSTEFENLKKWSVLSSKIYLWTYCTDFFSYLAPYDTYNIIQQNYQLAYKYNVYWLFDQAQARQNNSTGFHILKYYLNSKLAWNVNADVNTLIDEFFEKCYLDAAKPMRKLFDEIRTRFSYIENVLGDSLYIYVVLYNKNYFPAGLLQQWEGYIEEAYAEIEHLKNEDEDLYNEVHDSIMLESIFIRFCLIDLYGNNLYDAKTLLEKKIQFKNDCNALNVNCMKQSTDLNSYLSANWGV